MQFSVADVRRLGFQKICQGFYTTSQGRVAFLERLRIEHMMLTDIKMSAFTLPRKYAVMYDDLVHTLNYIGLVKFIDMCEPMLVSIDNPDAMIKRKVRNQYDSLWKCVGKDLDICGDTLVMLKELGLKIAVNSDVRISVETYEFYNAILGWYVYTLSEGSISELGLSPMDLISIMVLTDASDFISNICNGFH